MLEKIDQSQLAHAFSQAFSSDLPGPDCPSADELWKTCTLELDLESRKAIIDHCIHCAHCAQELRITREMVAEHDAFLNEVPANAQVPVVPKQSLVEGGGFRSLRIVPDESAESAREEAEVSQSKVISLGGWRRNLNKITTGCGVLAAAAALAFIVVKARGPGAERGDDFGPGVWRGQDNQSQGTLYRYSDGAFSWPALPGVSHYELEIQSVQGSKSKCVQRVTTHRFVFDPSLCPSVSPTQPFFWRVRPVTERGQGEFSRYFAVKAQQP